MALVDRVELGSDVAAARAGLDERDSRLMHLDINVPQTQVLVRALFGEERTLERRVIAGRHGKAVQAQNVAALDPARCNGIVGTIGVDAGRKPGPGIHQLHMGLAAADLAHHGLGRMQCHLVLRHAHGDCLQAGRAADVGDAGALANPGDLLVRFHHAHAHGRPAHIDQLRSGQRALQLAQVLGSDVVELDADPPAVLDQLLHGDEVVVPMPVGIGDAVAESAPPGLAAIDICGNRGLAFLRNHQAVEAPEGTVEEVAEVVDVVD